jgi:hypothetical protein
MVLALAVALFFTIRLLVRVRPLVLGSAPVTRGEQCAVGAFTLVTGAGSVLMFLASRSWAYHEAELWGAALALGAFESVIAFTLNPTRNHLWSGSALTTGALLSRGSVGLGPLVSLGVLLAASMHPRTRRAVGFAQTTKARRLLVPLLVAILVPTALYAYVNYAKFGTLFSLPFNRQVSTTSSSFNRKVVAANGGSMLNLRLLPTTALQYLRPDTLRFIALFPWVTFGSVRSKPVGDVIFEWTWAGSYTASMPLFSGLGLLGAACVVRARRAAGPPLAALRAPVVGGIVATLPTFAYAYIAHRYLSDFIPLGVVLAVAGLFVVLRWLRSQQMSSYRRATYALLAILAAASVWFNVGLAVMYGRGLDGSVNDHDLAAFVAFQYALHDRIPGGRPPYVRTGPELPPPRQHELFVIGRCDALFWSDGARWRALERGDAAGHFQFLVRFPNSAIWEPLVLSRHGPTVQYLAVRLLPGDRVQFAYPSSLFSQSPVVTSLGRRHNLEVLLDRFRGSLTEGKVKVTLDGTPVIEMVLPNTILPIQLDPLENITLGRGDVPGLAPRFTGTLQQVPPRLSLCRKLTGLRPIGGSSSSASGTGTAPAP